MKGAGAKKPLRVTLTLSIFLCGIISVALFVPHPPLANAQPYDTAWVDRYTLDHASANQTHAIHTLTFHIGPQVFWDGSTWQELRFEDKYATDGYMLIENSHVSAYIYDWYTVFYDPDNERVCVDDERWIVEVWSGKNWREVDLYNPTLTYSNNTTHLSVTRSFDCPEGLFTVTYVVWQASFLKHDVTFISGMDGIQQFRVTLKLSGIYSNKVRSKEGLETIASERHIVSPYFFVGEDNSNLVLTEYLWGLGAVNETTGEWESSLLKDVVFNTHAKGCKADIIIGNYTLAHAESLRIDPDTSTWQVGASSDDCQRRYHAVSGWDFWTEYFRQKVGHQDSTRYKYGGGMRFTGIDLIQGINIDAAYLKVCARYSNAGQEVNSKIEGEDADNATTFSDMADFMGRTRTSSMVYWDNIEAFTTPYWYTSPDIKTIVQEIVDRSGWASGNNIVLFWQDFDDRSTDIRTTYDYDLASSLAPKLEVTYTNPIPVIAEFTAPSVVKQNTYFNLNCNIKDGNGIQDFVNATVQISNEIILKWDNATDTFSLYLDTNGYCTLWNSGSSKTTLNATAYRLAWKIKFNNNYPEGPVDVIAANTKVFDSENNTDTNKQTSLFTFVVETGEGGTPEYPEEPEPPTNGGGVPYIPPPPEYKPPVIVPEEVAPWYLQYGAFILIGIILVAGAYRLKPKSTRQLFVLKTERKPHKRKKQSARAKPKTKLYHKKVRRKPRKPGLWKRLTRR